LTIECMLRGFTDCWLVRLTLTCVLPGSDPEAGRERDRVGERPGCAETDALDARPPRPDLTGADLAAVIDSIILCAWTGYHLVGWRHLPTLGADEVRQNRRGEHEESCPPAPCVSHTEGTDRMPVANRQASISGNVRTSARAVKTAPTWRSLGPPILAAIGARCCACGSRAPCAGSPIDQNSGERVGPVTPQFRFCRRAGAGELCAA
jgi:hypothetical protein